MKSTKLAPTFALVDPFGFSGIPMETMVRLLGNEHCELLINLMVEPINRFLTHPSESVRAHIEETYGTPDVHKIAGSSGDRVELLLKLYKTKLQEAAGFVGRFDMKPRRNSPNYSLFFASNHPLGFQKMKEAMWRTDKKSGSEYRGGNSITAGYELFGHDDLEEEILATFGEQTVRFEQVERLVVEATDYLPKHLRTVLKKLEDGGVLQVEMTDGGTRRGLTYPKGRTQLTFC